MSAPPPPGPRVVAAVVAHDRRDLLLEALAALDAQTVPLHALVVVDNASGDGTSEAALAWAREAGAPLDLVRLERNTGGAGGFAAAVARALVHHDPELVWLMDDDTVPTPTALQELLTARTRYAEAAGELPVVLASRVVWHDGREHPMNTPRERPGVGAAQRELAAAAGAVAVRSASFVSLLADAAAVRRAGLPLAAYFLWNDDFEFSTRLLRRGVGLHVRASVVEHRTKVFGSTDADPGPRFRFEVRNKTWMFTRSASLSPGEKLLYGGSTLRRWVRTARRSTDRRVLLAAGARGLVEGLRRPPATVAVMSGLGGASADVRAVASRTVLG